ncbi:hypothetical protein SJA_C1-03400 [Sphingobium indicum UT26S]|uniref:Uncharacterized protein n=1 Tax=Sphingobium indicum (strain DSM 16413 / CCM 7287 / MTCC 6362 / UT26 / NBRC 101211 / UT26S) TaxID=452662 RepID=D4YXU2_SPHIU|nr:hypothetical protein SJA_C1-03400 [Sphingobium indicum UT26S]
MMIGFLRWQLCSFVQKKLPARKPPSLVIAARNSDGLGPQPTSSVLSPAAGLLSKPEPDQRVMATQSDSLAVSDDAWWEGDGPLSSMAWW